MTDVLALQDITKDSVSTDDQSAYWYHRYSLRPLLDAQGHVSLTSKGAVHFLPCMLLAVLFQAHKVHTCQDMGIELVLDKWMDRGAEN